MLTKLTAQGDKPPLVTVVIPTHNRWPLVLDAVDSALAQTDAVSFEVIVVDDGSTDDTAGHLERERPQVSVLRQENSERAVARNHGLRHARGDFVIFLDADDLLEPWYLAEFTQRWSDVGCSERIFICPAQLWRPATGEIDVLPLNLGSPNRMLEQILRGTIWGVCCAVIPRSLALKVGGFPEVRAASGSEDWVFQLRLIATGAPLETLPKPAVRVREHEGRSTNDSHACENARTAALRIVLNDGFHDRPLTLDERSLALAGTHRFCAANAYADGRMQHARRHLREMRQHLSVFQSIVWGGRLWLQTWLGARFSRHARMCRRQLTRLLRSLHRSEASSSVD